MEDLEIALLRKFYLHNVWGKHHFREDTITKGFPSHLRCRIKLIAEELRQKGYLVRYPTNHGMQWYANIQKREEIKRLVMSKNKTLNE